MQAGDVISYTEMCQREGGSLQHGMNFRFQQRHSIFLMSTRQNAPYNDQVVDNGRTLLYEGHDAPQSKETPIPKQVDQPRVLPSGSLTRNGKFYQAAHSHKENNAPPERVRVYEKIKPGIWVFTGDFELVDAWREFDGNRYVFKFRLQLSEDSSTQTNQHVELRHTRVIPSHIKLKVWKRDNGQCRECGASDNLHFDHIIPFSQGGSSLLADNIQLLCARHNIQKRDQIR